MVLYLKNKKIFSRENSKKLTVWYIPT